MPATGSVVSTPAVVKPQITASGMPGHDAPLEKPDAAKIAHNNDIEEKEAAKRVLEKKEAQDSSAQMAALNARDPEKKGIGQPDLDRTPAQRENAATAQKPQGVIEKNAQSEKIVTWDEQSFRDRVEQVASGFTIKSGPRAGEFNFNRSYGADQRELGERFRASIRNGLGGYSKEKFMTASAEEQAEMIRDNSRLYLTANNMFGDKMAPDELARRLVNTFDELFGMEANKADGLLLRFWSTSRVVGMSVKELLEFKKRADDYSKSLGAHGGMSLRDLCEMALNAKAATNRGRGIEK